MPGRASTPERHRRVSELFLQVCELDPEERSTILDLRCADDPELRAAVEALVARDRSAEGRAFLEDHALELPGSAGQDAPRRAPGRTARWRSGSSPPSPRDG